MRWLPYILIVVGAYLLVSTAYDHYQEKTSIESPGRYPSITMPMEISKKEDSLGFRNAIVARYFVGVLLAVIGWRLARSNVWDGW